MKTDMDKQKSLREVADYIKSNGIEMVNFMYPAADGRLKTLNFTVNDDDYLLSILRFGESRKQRSVCDT